MKKGVIISLHAGYWLMYLFLLFVLFVLVAAGEGGINHNLWQKLAEWTRAMSFFAIIPGVIGFYSGYTFLFTHFFHKKRIGALFLFGIAVSMLAAVCAGISSYFIYGKNIMFMQGWSSAIPQFILMTFCAIINAVIGLMIRGFITSYADIRLKEELAKKNTETELALVKSQINPHFLFNTINNIDVLIGLDPVRASACLNKLSDIMRFMLYEAKTEKIPLEKELEYIEKYIELQKIRTSVSDYVLFEVKGDTAVLLEPMLFLPFIENAFKYAEANKIREAVRIRFEIGEKEVVFRCVNVFRKVEENLLERMNGGLGNELISKRLALLYPGRHELRMEERGEEYHVNLSIAL